MKTFFLILIGFAGAAKLDAELNTELDTERRNRKRGNKGGLLNLNPECTLGSGVKKINSEGFGELKSEHGSQDN